MFLDITDYINVKVDNLTSFTTPNYSLPQQEILPLGKNIYLHSLYEVLSSPLPEHISAPGDFIIYKKINTNNEQQQRLFICFHNMALQFEPERIYVMTFDKKAKSRRVAYQKTTNYITDRIEMKKIDSLKTSGMEIVAYGKWKLDTRVQYNLYGVKLGEKKLFKLIFVLSRYEQHFTEHDLKSINGRKCCQ